MALVCPCILVEFISILQSPLAHLAPVSMLSSVTEQHDVFWEIQKTQTFSAYGIIVDRTLDLALGQNYKCTFFFAFPLSENYFSSSFPGRIGKNAFAASVPHLEALLIGCRRYLIQYSTCSQGYYFDESPTIHLQDPYSFHRGQTGQLNRRFWGWHC